MPEVSSHTAGDVLTVKADNLTQIECQTLWAALEYVKAAYLQAPGPLPALKHTRNRAPCQV